MQKTVKVVDEVGNRYEATYVKRAQGLVKNGRARFIDDDTICLVRPPCNMEDIKMTDINKNEAVVETKEEKALVSEVAVEVAPSKYTIEYALEQIEMISKDNKHIYEALDTLKDVKSEGPGDIGAQQKAMGIADTVKCRETTNQQLISFYEKMIDDLKPKSALEQYRELWTFLQGCIAVESPGNPRTMTEYLEFFKAANQINN